MIRLRRRRGPSKLVTYRTESDNPTEAFAFRVIAGNGEQIGHGEGYTTRRDARRGTPAEGPKIEHRIQAALSGLALDAHEAADVESVPA